MAESKHPPPVAEAGGTHHLPSPSASPLSQIPLPPAKASQVMHGCERTCGSDSDRIQWPRVTAPGAGPLHGWHVCPGQGPMEANYSPKEWWNWQSWTRIELPDLPRVNALQDELGTDVGLQPTDYHMGQLSCGLCESSNRILLAVQMGLWVGSPQISMAFGQLLCFHCLPSPPSVLSHGPVPKRHKDPFRSWSREPRQPPNFFLFCLFQAT